MAKFRVLTEQDIKSGKMPKTVRQKYAFWKKAAFVLSAAIVLEHLALLYCWVK